MFRKIFLAALPVILVFFTPGALSAQSLKGKVIYVCPSQDVMIKFPSVISNYSFGNKDAVNQFETRITNDKNFSINSVSANFPRTNLTINEGGNSHLFIIEYKEPLDVVTESLYDYSKKKRLIEEQKKLKELASTTTTARHPPAENVPAAKNANAGNTGGTTSRPVAASKDVEENYRDIVNRANTAYRSGKYDEAWELYSTAKTMKPADPWPSSQITSIENMRAAAIRDARLRNVELSFQKHKMAADSAYNKKAYEFARLEYIEALRIKRTDQHSVAQLSKIEKMLNEERYNRHMKAGRDAVKNKSFDEAELAFNEALKVKVGDAEAKRELAAINVLKSSELRKENDQKVKALKVKQFNDSVTIADNMYQAGLFEEAGKAYRRADKMMPGDLKVQTRIKEIEGILSNKKSEIEKSRKDSLNMMLYARTIEKANSALELKDYKKAKAGFQQALALNPADKYAAERLSAIDIMMSQEAAIKNEELARKQLLAKQEKDYNLFLTQGKAALAKKQYEVAKDFYTRASVLKPAEKFPFSQLEMINAKLEEVRINNRFEHFIHIADSTAFAAKDMVTSLRYYDSARLLKPLEVYPQKQIKAINDQLLKMANQGMTLQRQKERTEIFNASFDHFEKGEDARLQRKYAEAYTGFSTFLSKLDTANVNEYLSSQAYYIRLAKDYVIRLEPYKPKPVVDSIRVTPKKDNRRNRKAKNT